MIIATPHPGEAHIHLDEGDTFHYPLSYLASGSFGIRGTPPFPLSSPIARLLHARYWLSEAVGPPGGMDLVLNEPSALHHFHVITIAATDHMFIDCGHLVGFSVRDGGRIATHLGGLVRPALWLIAHPLPVIASGPCTILVTGCRLYDGCGPSDHMARQIIAFDACARWSVRAPRSNAAIISDLWNAMSSQCQLVFPDKTRYIRSQVMPRTWSSHWRGVHILMHLALLALIAHIICS